MPEFWIHTLILSSDLFVALQNTHRSSFQVFWGWEKNKSQLVKMDLGFVISELEYMSIYDSETFLYSSVICVQKVRGINYSENWLLLINKRINTFVVQITQNVNKFVHTFFSSWTSIDFWSSRHYYSRDNKFSFMLSTDGYLYSNAGSPESTTHMEPFGAYFIMSVISLAKKDGLK